jgi:hypothetical protein
LLEQYHREEHVEAKSNNNRIQSIYWDQNFQTSQHTHDIDTEKNKIQLQWQHQCYYNVVTSWNENF